MAPRSPRPAGKRRSGRPGPTRGRRRDAAAARRSRCRPTGGRRGRPLGGRRPRAPRTMRTARPRAPSATAPTAATRARARSATGTATAARQRRTSRGVRAGELGGATRSGYTAPSPPCVASATSAATPLCWSASRTRHVLPVPASPVTRTRPPCPSRARASQPPSSCKLRLSLDQVGFHFVEFRVGPSKSRPQVHRRHSVAAGGRRVGQNVQFPGLAASIRAGVPGRLGRSTSPRTRGSRCPG